MGDNPLKTAEARHDLLIDYWGMGLTPEVTHRYMAKLFRQQAEKKADQGPSKKDKKKKKKGSQDKKDPNTEDSISLGFIDHLFKRFENEGEEGRKFREKDRKQYFMRVRRGKNDLIDNYLSVIKYPVYNMSLHIDLDRLDIVVQCFNNKEKSSWPTKDCMGIHYSTFSMVIMISSSRNCYLEEIIFSKSSPNTFMSL
uniref:Uncharacterized protein n=1 Tax=Caenorhabditis tropicalis TaxID=1561998 RepID=A0A1I7UV49_9PELO